MLLYFHYIILLYSPAQFCFPNPIRRTLLKSHMEIAWKSHMPAQVSQIPIRRILPGRYRSSVFSFLHCFFYAFSHRFWSDLGPKIEQKSIQNRCKMGVKKDAKNHNGKSRISKPFWDEFKDLRLVFKAILELSRANFQRFLANPRYQNTAVKHKILRQN